MKNDDEPNVWVSALKIIFGLTVMIGGIGLALWYADQLPVSSPALEDAIQQVREKTAGSPSSPSKSWGISKDSPIRR